jgi:hypothetical protein
MDGLGMTAMADRDGAVEAMVAREMELVRQAVAMVASGGSRRVVLGNLRFGAELLATAQASGMANGVRIVPLWRPDDSSPDLAVESLEPA